ncbi:MAG: hypothetical protein KVP17_002417 [Porospora cf. gigantea B]|uniref:uncharacterized protein n=1 Tax=Porospora cf. gigantea B TaxID=2853592 RepID=UPI003571F567|nr:MAG: hypothetical protein KVP17_002417 [Porospora cf. gigantea B]
MAAPTQPEGSTRAPQTREAFRIRGDLGDVGRNARGEWAPAEEGDELAIKMSFRAFVTTFTDSDTDNFTDGKYLLNLRKLLYGSQYQQLLSLAVSLSDVAAFDNTLLNYALTFPADSLVFMDEVVTDLLHEEIEGESDSFVRVALYNHPTPQPLRSLNPNELETLVAVGGVVIRVSSVLPDMQIAAFTCQNTVVRNQESVRCDFLTTVQLIEGEITVSVDDEPHSGA